MDNFDRFARKAVSNDQSYRMDKVTIKFSTLVGQIDKLIPEGREKALMLTKLEEACMWGVKGISREEVEEGEIVKL